MGIVIGIQALVVVAALAGAPQQGGSPAPPGGAPQTEQPKQTIELPVSLDRIQEAISRPPAFKPATDRPVFRVEVFARKPTVEDILGRDYLRGPVPASGGMSHREFLDMVTPVEYRGMSMFSNGEAITLSVTALALQWAVMKAVDKLKAARNERAKEAARKEVIDAMNQLDAARKKAGLPPK